MKKSLRISAFVLVLVMLFGGLISSAATFFTYTYDITGQPQTSPEIYKPYKQITSKYMGLGETALSNPTDIVVDSEGKVYIADPTNNRIVVLTKHWKLERIISSFVNQHGNADALAGARGLYVCDDGEIYVADTNNARIVVFNQEGKFVRAYAAPQSDVFEEGSSYTPIALAVDHSKRIYVVSSTATEGIISLNEDGSFATFIGAQKVVISAFETLRRKFMTAEQRALLEDTVPTPYNNITIDAKGFVYVTVEFTAKEYQDKQAAATKAASSDFSPVKRLNASGTDIMRRNGFFGPSGEVTTKSALTTTYSGVPTGVSSIVDVALGEEETWSIIDQKRSHIYTYDKNGNLLGIFGDKGTQLGNVVRGVGIAYQDLTNDGLHYLLALDADTNTIVVYERTEYGEILMSALHNTNQRKYDEATEDWRSILQRNNNYDAAYIGIGDALYREERWEDAMNYYKSASDVDSYSNAFQMYRKDIVSKTLVLIVAIIVLVLVGISSFFKFAGKHNKKTALKVGKKSFGDEILYAFHVMFHPFDGFWDLKHEKRGTVKGASFWIAMVIVGFTYQSVGQSYVITSAKTSYASVLGQIVSVLVPLILFVVANWCLTTLFEGEGSVKDIYTAVGYALAPMSFLTILSTIITNFVSLSEVTFVNLINGIAWVWVGLLLFFGIMVTHDFSLSKNIIMTVCTIVVMMVIMFIMVLFSGLVIKMISFVSNIVTEISYNM